jgi:hypothetical protein
MGSRGPAPKRSDERRRANVPEGGITSAPGARSVRVPEADESWHPMARDWFESLASSGQAAFYQPSDWQTARVWAEVLSRQLASDKMSAVMVQAWASSASELLTTEGSRRRGRLELERHQVSDADEDASVTALADYQARVGA